MDHINTGTLWFVIIALGIGSFGLRFVFTGLVGDREMPTWLLRHLRYTAVAILPALVAAALTIGVITKNVLLAIISGAATLYSLLWLLG